MQWQLGVSLSAAGFARRGQAHTFNSTNEIALNAAGKGHSR